MFKQGSTPLLLIAGNFAYFAIKIYKISYGLTPESPINKIDKCRKEKSWKCSKMGALFL